MRPEYTPAFVERFWSNVDRSGGPQACWPWKRHIGSQGYGIVIQKHGGRNGSKVEYGAHRAAFEITYGLILPTFFVCHNCPGGDRRACCNPRHLFVGTAYENNHDMIAKGRYVGWRAAHPRRGEAHYAAKLNDASVRAIRACMEAEIPPTAIATLFGIDPSVVSRVGHRKRWTHVED